MQGNSEWFAQRLGKVTASRVADVCAKTKTGWGASRANYMAQLVVERLTGAAAESYNNAAMQWGIDHEGMAKSAYEFYTDSTVTDVGFIEHPTIAMTGASPDGFVGDEGLVEIKCPNTTTHLETLLGSAAPSKYVYQMQWQMSCTGRKWCDFVSFDPRLPAHLQMKTYRIERDDKLIEELTECIISFLAEVDDMISKLNILGE